MKTIWNEATIRKEFARLNAKTGLKGATLPITFNNAKNVHWDPITLLMVEHFDSPDTIMMIYLGL